MSNLTQNMQGASSGKGRISQRTVWQSRPWTAPENRGQSPPKWRKAIVPMQLQTNVLPMFQIKACSKGTGRITADSVLKCVANSGKAYDEWKIRSMIEEMDYEGAGLSMASVRGALEGAHRYREYGPSDWLELVGLVLGISVQRLALSMDAAVPSTKMPSDDPGKSYKKDKAVEPMWSKSSSKFPGRRAEDEQFTQSGDTVDESQPNPWTALLRNQDAMSTTVHERSTRIVAPSGCATLDQDYNERAINICMHQTRATNKMTFEAQGEFNSHTRRLAAGDAMCHSSKSLDPRKIQSARYEKKSAEYYLAHQRPTRPVKSRFISMTGVPPISYEARAWNEDKLPTEAAERERNAWRDPDAYFNGPKPPSSKRGYYRCVRVDKSNMMTSPSLRPATTSSNHRPTAARGDRHSSPMKHRPSTATQVMSSSINPLVKAETLRLEGCLSVEGGLIKPGIDVRGPHAKIGTQYPQPSSEVKKLRHDISHTSKPPFRPYAKPLGTGLHSMQDFQTLLGGNKATMPIQFWQEGSATSVKA